MTIVWILGRGGLLGSAMSRALERTNIKEFRPRQLWNWQNEDDYRRGMEEAVEDFSKTIGQSAWQIHWAAGTGTMASTKEDLVQETKSLSVLLNCIENNSILRGTHGTIMFASSAGAIYAGSKDEVITEDSKSAPLNTYGQEKLEQEEILRAFASAYANISLLIARLSNLYGAEQSRTKKQGLLSHIARSILMRRPINIFVPFDTIRDYMHVDDAAVSILDTVQQQHHHEIITKIFASERPVTIAEIIGTFKHVTRVSPRIIRSSSALSTSYVHRMKFRSKILPSKKSRTTSLLVGIAEVMAAERRALMRGS